MPLRSLLFAAIGGCVPVGATPPTTGPTTSPTAGSDISIGPIPDDTDLCAFEDTAPALPATPAEPQEPDVPARALRVRPHPYAECLDGLVLVTAGLYEGGAVETYSARLELFETSSAPGAVWDLGTELDPLEGIDDCGLIEVASGGALGTGLVFQDGGEVRVTGTWGTTGIGPRSGPLSVYEVVLSELDIAPDYGLPHRIDHGGAVEVELPDVVMLPERLEVIAPFPLEPGTPLARADLGLEWTGTGEEPLAMEILSGGYVLWCEVADDGAFTIPGDLLAPMTAGADAYLSLVRSHRTMSGTRAGATYYGLGTTEFSTALLVQ